MADSAGAFYLQLSQTLEAMNAVASYVTLHFAVQRLIDKLQSNRSDGATKALVMSAMEVLEQKKQALGAITNCKSPYEDFLRQAKAANNPN